MTGMLRVTFGVILLTTSICRVQTSRQGSTEDGVSLPQQSLRAQTSTRRGSTENGVSSPQQSFLSTSSTPSSLVVPKVEDPNDIMILASFCPYSDICQYAGRDVPDKKTSCCTSCSCDPSCGALGNCCDDRLNVDRKRSCYVPLVTNGERPLPLSYKEGYWLVDRCSNSSSDTDCKLMTSEPWGSMYPVYDAASDVSYYNQYCAECNGVQEFTYWDVGVSCFHSHVSYSNAVIVGGLLGKGCGVSFTPPREQLDQQVCYPNAIQQCNVTGLWETYDAELESACSLMNSPASMQGILDTYANVFCLLCNGMSFERDQYCEEIPSRNVFEANLFTTAIDYRKISSALTETSNHRPKKWDGTCRSHMVKHPFKDECRDVLCPDGYLRIDGDCVPLSSTKTRLAYLIQFQLTPTTNKLLPMSYLHEVYADEARLKKADTWFKCGGIPLEYMNLFAETINVNNEVFARKLIVRIGKMNSPIIMDTVLKTIKIAISQEWELSFYGQVYRFSVNIDKFKYFVFDGTLGRYNEVEVIEKQTYTYSPDAINNKIYEPIGVYWLDNKRMQPSVALTKMNFCEKVHLERSEWVGLWQEIRLNLTGSGDEKVLGDSEYNMYADDQGRATVDICVEDFDPLYDSYTANTAPTCSSFCQMLAFICFLLSFLTMQ